MVTSSDSEQGLQGVNIVVKSNGHGTISGLHGEYQLGDIPEGAQKVIFSFMGYETLELKLDSGSTQLADVALVPGSIELSSVTVEAQRPFSAASST